MNKKVAIIGCGNLGLSILNGLLSNERTNAKNIMVTKRDLRDLEHLKSTGVVVTSDNAKAVREAELIILALKPYTVLSVMKELQPLFDPKQHIVVSLATGISIDQIQDMVGKQVPVFRAMPNTAADVGMSMTCISSYHQDPEMMELVRSYFNTFGTTVVIDEDLMDSATVLGACGIAYALRFIRAMIQGGVQIGFDARMASTIATQTVKGAAELLISGKQHPEFEIDKVTTPKGCTISGLNEMEHNGFSSALIKGIVTSFEQIEK